MTTANAIPATKQLVQLDGRTLEGGGQLVRIAVGLSALTGIPIEIDNIRGARPSGGGLKAQHLTAVNWLALACNAKTEGARKGSKKLLFEPGVRTSISPVFSKRNAEGEPVTYESIVDIGTAGSTGLVLQAILPYILFAPPLDSGSIRYRLTISGGTNVSHSPSFEYIDQVLLPTLETIGLPKIKATLLSRGWAQGRQSKGSILVEFTIKERASLSAFHLQPAHVADAPPMPNDRPIPGLSLVATFLGPQHAHSYAESMLEPSIQQHFGLSVSRGLTLRCEDSGDDKRLYLLIVATVESGGQRYRLGRDWLYDRKIRSMDRAVADLCNTVSKDIFAEWYRGAWVDEHMRDQLVIYQALAKGVSGVWPGRDRIREDIVACEPSLHTQTAEWVAKQLLGIQFADDSECEGINFEERDLSGRLAGLQLAGS